jgi:hypothetical protein
VQFAQTPAVLSHYGSNKKGREKILSSWELASPVHDIQIRISHMMNVKSTIKVVIKDPDITDKKGKAIPVTDHGGPYGFETSRIPHFLDNRLTDGSEVVRLTSQPAALYPQEDCCYSFLLEAESKPGP